MNDSMSINGNLAMALSFEDSLATVWRQLLIENKKVVTLEDESFRCDRAPLHYAASKLI
jgi:hypothetical protein